MKTNNKRTQRPSRSRKEEEKLRYDVLIVRYALTCRFLTRQRLQERVL